MNNKQYLISFLASIQGDKLVVTGLRKMQRETAKTGRQTGRLAKGTKNLGQQFSSLAMRAVLTIPVWLALRSIFMGIITTIRDMITANLDLEEGLARIKTVVSASSKTVDSDMGRIKQKILDVAVKTRAPIKDLAEAFYFLRTANLSTQQAMDAFEPVISAMVGTMNNAKDTARATAGIFNTMGDAIGATLTDAEKMWKIADLLTFTYATQDVQLQELTESYTKFAPYVSGLSDDFTEIITTLGFLNTRLLRGGRTGRLTGRAILQLTKNSSKLADIFGITFDPNKPIKFLDVIEKVSKQIQRQGVITAEQGDRIQEVFATRAGVAVRLLVTNFEELQKQITRAREEADGFAQRMKTIREETTRAQLGRLKNILAVLAHEFMNNALAGMTLGNVLKSMNDNLEENRDAFRKAGAEVGYYTANLRLLVDFISQVGETSEGARIAIQSMNQVMGKGTGFDIRTFGVAGAHVSTGIRLFKMGLDAIIDKVGITRKKLAEQQTEFQKEQDESTKLLEEFTAKQKADVEATETRRNTLKEIQQMIKHQVTLMKIVGASELEIAEFKSRALDLELGHLDAKDEILKVQKDYNNLIEKELQTRKNIQDQYLDAQLVILKTLGASELDIIDAKRRQLELVRETIGEGKYLLELEDLRLQKAVAITKAKQKEWDTVSGLFSQFAKADELERGRLKRVIKLIAIDPEDLATKYRKNMFDRRLIDEYFSHFSKKGKFEVNKVRNEIFKLGIEVPEGKLELNLEEQIQLDLAVQFGVVWEKRMLEAVDKFKVAFLEAQKTVAELSLQPSAIQTITGKGTETPSQTKSGRQINIYKIEMGDRTITVRGEISEEMAERIAKQEYETIKKRLLEDGKFKANLSEDM